MLQFDPIDKHVGWMNIFSKLSSCGGLLRVCIRGLCIVIDDDFRVELHSYITHNILEAQVAIQSGSCPERLVFRAHCQSIQANAAVLEGS